MANPRKSPKASIGLDHDDHASGAAAAVRKNNKRNTGRSRVEPDIPLFSDLQASVSPTKAEIALLRAFLADEIDAILRDGD